VIDELGGPKHFNHFPSAWAHAMDTPFQWTKQVASHFGGTRNPLIVSWPARIKDRGGLREQFLHVIDIVPTLYEVISITPPVDLNGVQQKPIEGLSFAHTFDDAKAKSRRTTQYFELVVNRGLYHNGWMASAISFPPWQPIRTGFDPDKQQWELYNVDQDFSQADDLAAANPQKLRELQDLWWVEAARYNVLPLYRPGVVAQGQGAAHSRFRLQGRSRRARQGRSSDYAGERHEDRRRPDAENHPAADLAR
jgi:arylsulfatase